MSYGISADIWALGVLACELLMGASPFEGDTKEETYAKILAGNVRLPSHLSEEAQDFMHKVRRACHAQALTYVSNRVHLAMRQKNPCPGLKAVITI